MKFRYLMVSAFFLCGCITGSAHLHYEIKTEFIDDLRMPVKQRSMRFHDVWLTEAPVGEDITIIYSEGLNEKDAAQWKDGGRFYFLVSCTAFNWLDIDPKLLVKADGKLYTLTSTEVNRSVINATPLVGHAHFITKEWYMVRVGSDVIQEIVQSRHVRFQGCFKPHTITSDRHNWIRRFASEVRPKLFPPESFPEELLESDFSPKSKRKCTVICKPPRTCACGNKCICCREKCHIIRRGRACNPEKWKKR